MTKQDLIRKKLKPNGIFNLRYIEKNSGLRKFKLYEFINDKTRLSNEESESVLECIKNATKLQR
jgi:hypothetical protein